MSIAISGTSALTLSGILFHTRPGCGRAINKAILTGVQVTIIPTVEGAALYAELIKRPLGGVR